MTRDELAQPLADQITERIKDISREQGITGRELGRRLGRSHGWLSGLFSGRQPYDLDDLAAIGKALGVTVERLLGIGPGYLPPPVQRLVDHFAEALMRYYNSPKAGAPERRALLSAVRDAWRRGVELAMEYWQMEIERPPIRERGYNTTPSRPRKSS